MLTCAAHADGLQLRLFGHAVLAILSQSGAKDRQAL